MPETKKAKQKVTPVKRAKTKRGILDTRDPEVKKGKKRYHLYAGYVTREQAVRAARTLRQETKGTEAFVKKNPKKLEPYEVWVRYSKPFWGKKGGGMSKIL